MKKLKLNVEALAVQTFDTAVPAEARGTVAGHVDTDPESCDYACASQFISGCGTCGNSCGGTCGSVTCIGYEGCNKTQPLVCPY